MQRLIGLSISSLSVPALGLAALLTGSSTCNAQIVPIATVKGANGSNPMASVRLWHGDLYGTTMVGGAGSSGTIWKMAEGGLLGDIASFDSTWSNGSYCLSRATFDSAGNMWGTAGEGGAYGYGTVWEICKGSTTIQVIA